MIRRLFTEIAGVYDRMNHVLSLGLDRRWRRKAAELVRGNPRRILDLACGTGDFTFALARRFPEADIRGADLTAAMLDIARRKNRSPHITFLEADAENLAPLSAQSPAPELVSCAFGFRNFPNKAKALSEVNELIAANGELLVLEFFRPKNKALGTLTSIWVAALAALFARGKSDAYRHLRDSMRTTLSEAEFVSLASALGFVLEDRLFLLPCCTCLRFICKNKRSAAIDGPR